jgi:putative nucleotidyltransferase with HDIG domain
MSLVREVRAPAPLSQEEMRRVVQRVVDLPTLPVIIPRIIRLMEDPRSSAAELGRVIASDQALASRILRLANSAFYGFRREIVSINQAVVLLGFDTVKSIVLAATVLGTLGEADVVSSFDREQFWLHVLATAMAARRIARARGWTDPEAAFVAGLLHDIGKVILDRYFYRHYAEAARLAAETPCLIREAESKLFSLHHGQVGGWLAERWRFPAALVEPVAWHHAPAGALRTHGTVAGVVHLADILVRNAGIGSGGDTLVPLPDPAVLAGLQVTGADLARWTEELAGERQAVTTFLQVMR